MRKSTRMTKLVVRYEGGSSSLLSADPEGEEFLQAFDASYQTHVEAYINLIAMGEPVSFKEAITSLDKDKWETAMDEEMTSLMDMGTFALIDCPKDR